MAEINWTAEAEQWLKDIHDYIAQDNPRAAIRLVASIYIFRLLGFFKANNIVTLNHAFTKKTQKTPAGEINIAEKRKREYLKERGLL